MAQRSILITGCSSGIGRDAATALAGRGWRVFATVRTQTDAQALAGANLDPLIMDYARSDSIAACADTVLERTGGTLDALFNNGAFASPGAVEDLPVDALRAIFEANVFGWHDLTRRVIPAMRAQGHGRIVQCSSVLGIVAAPWRGAYVASKFAVEGLSQTMRLEMRGTGIDVVTIRPGPIGTRIRQNSIPHFERWIDWRASPLRGRYESDLRHRLYDDSGPDSFERPASAVTAVLIRALEARRPRPVYHVTVPTHAADALRRLLPTRFLDRILAR